MTNPKTPALKVFTGSHLFPPQPWLEALDTPRHIQQCDVIGVAATKAALAGLLGRAGHLAGPMRVARWYSAPVRLLIDAGIIDLTQPGVYAWRGFVKDHAVIRVDPDGACITAGWFRLAEYGAALTAEKADGR